MTFQDCTFLQSSLYYNLISYNLNVNKPQKVSALSECSVFNFIIEVDLNFIDLCLSTNLNKKFNVQGQCSYSHISMISFLIIRWKLKQANTLTNMTYHLSY